MINSSYKSQRELSSREQMDSALVRKYSIHTVSIVKYMRVESMSIYGYVKIGFWRILTNLATFAFLEGFIFLSC